MPELPEVETIRLGLLKTIVGRRIVSAQGLGGRLTRNNPGGVNQVIASLQGSSIMDVRRRGKFMWWELDGPDDSLVVHLGMSGQVRTTTASTAAESVIRGETNLARHEHLRLTLDDGSLVGFVDPRMFGQVTLSGLVPDRYGLVDTVPEIASHIAPDLLEIETQEHSENLAKVLNKRQRAIKTMLLDQGLVSGVGNIYADEGLFRSHVSGLRVGSSISVPTLITVIDSCRQVMRNAVEVGGTSFDSLYVDVEGNPGYFSRELQVYGREGEQCRDCGSVILRTRLNGRSHFFCSTCQQ